VPVLLLYVAVLGLLLGSFGNVVIYRVPLQLSLIKPPSQCPGCAHPIRYRENIPVASWLVLRGRCAHCGERISARYPLVELATSVLFVAITLRLDALGLLPALPAYLYFAGIGIVLSLIDIDSHRLPNVIVLPSYGVLLALMVGATAWQGEWVGLRNTVVGALALFACYLAIATAYPAGMGFGDVKLSGLIGGVLGYLSWGTLVVGAFAGFLLGAVVGVAMMALGGASRKSMLPFGPFMIAGALFAVFAGNGIAEAYLHLSTRV
jgi:leader peptidase (prepilin peptidase)/N-methyltransferase